MGWDEAVAQNRRAWNEIARLRSGAYADSVVPAEVFREGGKILDDRAIAAGGNVGGRRLLHLMCATGEETLLWAVLGADGTRSKRAVIQVTR